MCHCIEGVFTFYFIFFCIDYYCTRYVLYNIYNFVLQDGSLKQPECRPSALNIMEICDQSHTNANKQRTLMDDVDIRSAFYPARVT